VGWANFGSGMVMKLQDPENVGISSVARVLLTPQDIIYSVKLVMISSCVFCDFLPYHVICLFIADTNMFRHCTLQYHQ
jgi:hypothetical protein